jgi:hypothetical protein
MEIITGVPMTEHVVVFNDEIYTFVDLRCRPVAEWPAQSTGRYSRPNRARMSPSGPSRHGIKGFEFRERRHLLADVPSFMSCTSTCHYDAPPDATLASVRAQGGPVLVGLDETLYPRNSTEDFIDCVWRGLLRLMLLRVLEVLKPWRLTGDIDTRGTWRVYTISIFFPGLIGAAA